MMVDRRSACLTQRTAQTSSKCSAHQTSSRFFPWAMSHNSNARAVSAPRSDQAGPRKHSQRSRLCSALERPHAGLLGRSQIQASAGRERRSLRLLKTRWFDGIRASSSLRPRRASSSPRARRSLRSKAPLSLSVRTGSLETSKIGTSTSCESSSSSPQRRQTGNGQ